MRCSSCGFADTKVIESRLSFEGRSVRRRRSCPECNSRFTTYEREEDTSLHVLKNDGRVEAYQREKLVRAMRIACQKRPITPEEVELVVNRIEKQLHDDGERTVPSKRIGDLAMTALQRLDKIAYVRFASVYKDFKDTSQFMTEVRSLEI